MFAHRRGAFWNSPGAMAREGHLVSNLQGLLVLRVLPERHLSQKK